MATAISLKGIDEGISNLNYRNPKALKSKLVHAIRGYYEQESFVQSPQEIDAEELIKALWDTGDDPDAIKAKRKNLSSTKSSVNSDFKKLYKQGKNTEGVFIGRENIFVMSDEAKDEILSTFKASIADGETVTIREISEVLSTVKEILSDVNRIGGADSSDSAGKLKDLRNVIQGLAEQLGMGGKGLGEDEEAEELEQIDEDELEETLEEVEVDDALEEAEVAEDLEEVDEDELEETLEEVEVDDALEEAEVEDDIEEVDVEEELEEAETNDELEVVEEEAPAEAGLPVGSLGEEDPGVADDDIEKARLLAEEFDGYLGTMERYHNQHILIPEGEYIVGSKAPKGNERPEQRVRLAAFYLGKFPVTNSLFEIFVEKTGYRTTAENQRYSTVYFGRVHEGVDERTGLVKVTFNATVRSETVHGACWHQPFGPGSTLYGKRNHPVVHVSFEDAMAFAAWTGKRLPTENEWEAAARTTNGYVFPWGDERKSNACNIEESAVADTTPVDKFTEFQNDFGIADTLGNVLEWTLDTSEPSSHGKSNGGYQIVKGGSWISGNDICAFSRFKTDPASPSNIVGFRCVAY